MTEIRAELADPLPIGAIAPGFNPDRAYNILLLSAMAMLVAPVGIAVRNQFSHVPIAWLGVLLVGLTTALGLAVVALWQRTSPRPSALVFVLTTLVGLLTLPMVSAPYALDERPWVTSLLPVAVASCALIASPPWLARGLAAGLIGGQLWVVMGGTWAAPTTLWLTETLYALTLFTISQAVVTGFGASWARVHQSHSDATQQYARARAAESASAARALWNAYVHDEVLAELAVIAASPDPTASRAAAQRLLNSAAWVDRSELPQPPLQAGLIDVTLNRYPSAVTDLVVDEAACPLPDEIVRALLDAAAEALRNVGEHAYQHNSPGPVTLSLRHRGDGVRVDVIDKGRGFTLDSLPTASLGIIVAIQGRMAAVGGHGKVWSQPGAGTSVTLTWQPKEQP